MKRLFFILAAVCMAASVMAAELSNEGRVHYNRAMSLLEIATLADDYKKVANELEQVILTDPNYAYTYLYMSRVNRKIGEAEGEAYFTKADKCIKKFYQLAPNEADTYRKEVDENAKSQKNYTKQKAAASLPLVGKWKYPSNPSSWYINVTNNNGKYGISVNAKGRVSVTKVDDYTFDIQIFRQEKMDGKYEDDCNSDADPGYPKSGVYYYDEWRHTDHERITLNGNAVHVKMYRQHTDYYLNGSISHKETHTSAWYFSDDDLIRY